MKNEIILGIDPGTAVTGFGIIRIDTQLKPIEFGCIRPPRSKLNSQRYKIIFEALCSLIEKHKPTACVVEKQYVDKNVQSAITLGIARGMAILAATLHEIPIFEYAPTRAKKAVSGTGRASKQQVEAMIRRLLSLGTTTIAEDAADALALAICHAHTAKSGRSRCV